MRTAGSEALDQGEKGHSGPAEDTAMHAEGSALKRLLRGREMHGTSGVDDLRVEGDAGADRSDTFHGAVDMCQWTVPTCITRRIARSTMQIKHREYTHNRHRAEILHHTVGDRSASVRHMEGALMAGSVQHTAHKQRLAVDTPKCEAHCCAASCETCTCHQAAPLCWSSVSPQCEAF